MDNNIQNHIRSFFQYFDHTLDVALDKINVGHNTILFQLLICSGIIDTLAKCCTPSKFSNYHRFTEFVKNFCEWKEYSKISLPHLVRFLQCVPSLEFSELRKYAYDKIDTWEEGRIIYIKDDPDYKEIFDLWPKDPELRKPIKKISLVNLSHIDLLWQLRNNVVHEMRLLGYGMHDLVREKPGYHSMSNVPEEKKANPLNVWELVYPVPFFKILIRTGIKNLRKYCQENRLDPLDRFEFGSYWISEFNTKYNDRR